MTGDKANGASSGKTGLPSTSEILPMLPALGRRRLPEPKAAKRLERSWRVITYLHFLGSAAASYRSRTDFRASLPASLADELVRCATAYWSGQRQRPTW